MSFFDEFSIKRAVREGYDGFNLNGQNATSPYKTKGLWYAQLDGAWAEGFLGAMHSQRLEDVQKEVIDRFRNPRSPQ